MDTKKIEVLLRALELGSLSKAAQEYLYTPSAVSHILDTLEDELGTKIVRRTYRGIEPEEGCEEIISGLKEILEAEKRVIRLSADKKKRKSTITVGTYSSISKYILPRLTKGFKEVFPHIEIDIIVGDKMKDFYHHREADVILGEPLSAPDVIFEKLLTDSYVAILPPSFPCERERIRREELYNGTFIMAMDTAIQTYMKERPTGDIIRVNSHDDSSILQMVKADIGLSILPSLSIERGHGLVCKELEPTLSRVLGLVYRKNDFKKNPNLRAFIEYTRNFDLQQPGDTLCSHSNTAG